MFRKLKKIRKLDKIDENEIYFEKKQQIYNEYNQISIYKKVCELINVLKQMIININKR